MDKRIVYLVASSRLDGNTWALLEHMNSLHQFKAIDLGARHISYFDYSHKNIDDEFIGTVEELLEFDTIGFVSPVYWYTVSAQMKTFIDRISDLLSERKDLGRALAGKNTFLIATGGTDDSLPQGMEDTIKLTSQYMDMKFLGSFYAKATGTREFLDGSLEDANKFLDHICKQ